MGPFPVFVWRYSEAGQFPEGVDGVGYEEAFGFKGQPLAGAAKGFPQDLELFGVLWGPVNLTRRQQFHQEVTFLADVVGALVVEFNCTAAQVGEDTQIAKTCFFAGFAQGRFLGAFAGVDMPFGKANFGATGPVEQEKKCFGRGQVVEDISLGDDAAGGVVSNRLQGRTPVLEYGHADSDFWG